MRALISVSDKTGVVEFAKGLRTLGWEVIATGGTMKLLADSGVEVINISDVTGFPEICDGRVKTLHPNVHGGLLARRDDPEHLKALKDNHIEFIDMVCVNLYPFRETISKPGVKMEDITEIYSHQQALSQCEQYLQAFPGVKIIPCENTAVAAQKVAEGDGHAAALSSRSCMKLYGLECLEAGVQDQGSNFTRFICISKNLEIYPGADRTSLMAVLPHEPGSLCRVLSRFYALGLNLNKLESRPMPERNFEFMFYFDLETPVYAPEFLQLMGELPSLCEEFSYLGSYSEVV